MNDGPENEHERLSISKNHDQFYPQLNQQFFNLPKEVFTHIATFLPAYSLVGKQSIHTVCKDWNNALQSETFRNKKKSYHPEMVTAILNNNTLGKKLIGQKMVDVAKKYHFQI